MRGDSGSCIACLPIGSRRDGDEHVALGRGGQIVRATCRCAAPGEPPGRMKLASGPTTSLQLVDQRLERVDVARLDLRERPLALVFLEGSTGPSRGGTAVLDRRQRRGADRGTGPCASATPIAELQLVDGAVGGDARRVAGDALAAAEAGRAVRRPCGYDLGQSGMRGWLLPASPAIERISIVAFDRTRAFWSRWATPSPRRASRAARCGSAIFCTSSSL